MTQRGRVVVIGSVNTDLLVRVASLPAPGETVLAREAREAAGGKGRAQATAAARFGAATRFIAAVGDDADGHAVLAELREEGIDTALVRIVDAPTGRAIVSIDDAGENSIVVIPGANGMLDSLTEGDEQAVVDADVVLMQLETGTGIALETITRARENGVTIVLNAAPPPELDRVDVDGLLGGVTYLIVNEVECQRLAGGPDLDESARALAQLCGSVIVTLGGQGGALYRGSGAPLRLPALNVTPLDTTGAGDAFCGVFAAAIAEGRDVESALRLALTAGSLATLTAGNVPASPSREQVLASSLERP